MESQPRVRQRARPLLDEHLHLHLHLHRRRGVSSAHRRRPQTARYRAPELLAPAAAPRICQTLQTSPIIDMIFLHSTPIRSSGSPLCVHAALPNCRTLAGSGLHPIKLAAQKVSRSSAGGNVPRAQGGWHMAQGDGTWGWHMAYGTFSPALYGRMKCVKCVKCVNG